MRKQPNVLLIILDATRADHLSCYGYSRNTSPFLDGVAERGVLYRQAVSVSPWTLPSIASIFTGRFPSSHGTDVPNPYLSQDQETLAEFLKACGYQTFAVADGSWVSAHTRFHRGFDAFRKLWQLFQDPAEIAAVRTVARYGEGSFKARQLWRCLRAGNPLLNAVNSFYGMYLYKRFDYGAKRINRFTKEWLDETRTPERPSFIYLHYMEPHLKYAPPKEFRRCYLEDDDGDARVGAVNQDAWDYICGKTPMSDDDFRILTALYDAEIRYQDRRIQELWKVLENRIDLDDTLVIITADHGENLGDHGLMDHQYCLYDSLLRVPLIVKYPRGEFDGVVVEDQVQSIDIFRTIADRIDPDGEMQHLEGKSFLPSDTSSERIAFAEYLSPQPSAAVLRKRYPGFDAARNDRRLKALRDGRFKYIVASTGEQELYDVVKDPGEVNDLANSEPQRCGEMRERLFRTLPAFEQECTAPAEMEKRLRRRLEALGYLSRT